MIEDDSPSAWWWVATCLGAFAFSAVTGVAFAAVPVEAADELAEMKFNALTLVGLITVALCSLFAIKHLRMAIIGGPGAESFVENLNRKGNHTTFTSGQDRQPFDRYRG